MTRRITTDDGVQLAIRESGNPTGPAVVCVHGFPDNSSLWDGVAEHLGKSHRVIVYDVRGAGQSDRPTQTKAYLLDRLAADLASVINDTCQPNVPVHLLAHDWGSIQVWHALTRCGQRAASFTSISGPDLARARAWMRAQAKRGPRVWARLANQLARSTYIVFFHLPFAPTLASRTGLVARMLQRPIDHQDFKYGLNMYRANIFHGPSSPAAPLLVRTQVIVPTRDPFVSPDMQTVEGATIRTIDAGHWLPLSRPDIVAQHVAEFIASVKPSSA